MTSITATRTSDLATVSHTACTIEERCGDGRSWQPVSGDATGWTLRGARRALRSLVATLASEDVADLYRIVRRGEVVETLTAEECGYVHGETA